MRKIWRILLLSIVIAAQLSYAQGWQTYTDKKQGYQLSFPSNGVVTTGKSIRKGFYLDPFQPVTDLMQQPGFEHVRMNPKYSVKVSFPERYLIILTLDNAPNRPPPLAKAVTIGQHHFWYNRMQDAGMCHDYDYSTYYLLRKNQYLVFIFLTTTDCFSKEKQGQAQDGANKNNPDFENILATVRIR